MSNNEQAVRERAYFIWEGEGRLHGQADAHWLRAEVELSETAPVKKAAKAPARKAEGAAKVAALSAKAAPAPVATPVAAAAVSPARKAAKPKATAGAAVAAATVGKAKPARARAALH
jgi:hypothetical protein